MKEREPSSGSVPCCLLCPTGATEQRTVGCGPSQGKGRNISDSCARAPVCHFDVTGPVLQQSSAPVRNALTLAKLIICFAVKG